MPTPNWPICHIEVFEGMEFCDDGFRTDWTAIAMANEPTDKHFWTTWDVVGDVAEMYVKESASSEGAGYRRDISAKNLSTTTYPILRARLKGSDTQPYYKIRVIYTDDSFTDTGWFSAATDAYFIKSVDLTAGKTVKYVELYAKSTGGSGSEAKVWWDYIAIIKTNPFIPTAIEELDIDLQTTVAVSGFKFKLLRESGVTYPGVGAVAMIYLAAEGEALEQKLIKGRVSEREGGGEPDNPTITFSGEDFGRLLQDRTFIREYTSPTQPSQILKDALDAEVPELTHESVDATDNAIKPRLNEQNIYSLARDFAEACKDSSGTRGFDLWVDPGDDVRFKTLCAYTCPHRLSDGSDGYAKNIQAIKVRDSDHGLANSVKVIIFEEEYEPRDRDSYTENKERWTLTAAIGSSLSEDTDCKRGNRSIKASVAAGSQSCQLSLGQDHSLYIDISQAEKIRFWIKSNLQNVDPNTVEIVLFTDKNSANTYSKTSLGALPSSWEEKEYNLNDFTKTGNPSKIVTMFQFACEPTQGNSLSGNLWIDGLHFVLPEKAKTSEDPTSISRYGKRKKRYIRKEVTDEDYAQHLATNLCQLSKNPTTNISATVLGKAQPGYRPPQKITVTSLKDGIDQKDFRIARVRHHYVLGNYTCELDLVAAKTDVDTYEPKICSREVVDIGNALTNLQKRQDEASMGIIRGEWKS